MRTLPLILLAVLTLGHFSAASAQIPVFYNYGDDIDDLGELSPEAAAMVEEDLGSVSIGFLHKEFSIYGLEFWTWGGQHVLYRDDEYVEMTDEAWNELLGPTRADRLSTPLTYRFPPGAVLIVLLVVGILVKMRFFPSTGQVARKRLKEPRYPAALGVMAKELERSLDAGEKPDARVQERAFQLAVDHLRAEGVPGDEAERELRNLLPHVTLDLSK